MKKVAYSFVLAACVAVAFVAGTQRGSHTAASVNAASERKILYYHDPMHPEYKSDKPGIAPDCGMDLVPVYADGEAAEPDLQRASSSAGVVKVSPEKQAVSGIRVGEVSVSSGTADVRLPGRVVPDERRVFTVNAGTDGFITRLSSFTTGSYVKKNQWLGAFATGEMATQFQTYLVGVTAVERLKQSGQEIATQVDPSGNPVSSNFQQRVDRLRQVGVSDVQLEEVKNTHKVPHEIDLRAPASGFVLARNVWENQKFDKGAEFLRLADLSRVWIIADVLDQQQRLRPGMRAKISVPRQSETFTATISEVLPQIDPASRTLKVRLEVDNPGYVLRPDMYVDVNVAVNIPRTLTVPADAVLDSGLSKTVFVERSKGAFESRKIETGARYGDSVQVTSGLAAGERIVVSGTFLVDSESRLNSSAANFTLASQSEVKDPVCGMEIDQAKAASSGKSVKHEGREYYFCSDKCKREFQRSPAQYTGERPGPGHPPPNEEHKSSSELRARVEP